MKIQLLLILLFPLISWTQSNLIKLEGKAQGTTYHITYIDAKKRDLKPEIDEVLQGFDESVSTYKTNSIISRINRNEKKVKVDAYFTTCFLKAKEIWKSTEGAFDPTVFPIVNAWGWGPGKKQKIEKEKIDSMLTFVGFEKIELKGKYVRKTDPRVALDFNAFAQGYSVDVVSKFLIQQGITSFIVEIGGELYAQGKTENNADWLIGVEQPFDNKTSGNPLRIIIRLNGKAVATSGNYRKFVVENGIKYDHHIDPKTGYPAKNNLLSATIISDQCITSDATATGILVMGLDKAKIYLANHPELEAYLIYSDEQGNYAVYETPGFANMIETRE